MIPSPPRLVPQAGPAAWAGSALSPADWMLPVGADVAAGLAEPEAPPAGPLAALLRQVAERLDEGRGFCLIRGLNLDRVAEPDAALLALGRQLGRPLPQDAAGALVAGPAGDRGFRADPADAAALLCLGTLPEGAVALVSAPALHNTLLKADRAALAVLYRDLPYGEGAALPVFTTADGAFLGHLDRAAMAGAGLDAGQAAALAGLEAMAEAPGQALALPLHAGDLLLTNPRLVWTRIAPGSPGLRRLWLERPGPRSLPEAFRRALGTGPAPQMVGG
ncbi:hypothetical protein [Belnapia rosea]|uniref:hypothetical protein n=1 Tax=Belnapia rosea TaxID=938405 RepID=UPI0008840591|nr:hypothetical protein [Belnapia rosea]SDB68195.1 hypothetical protein SAMN02927895_03151 [Belnapia rosea]